MKMNTTAKLKSKNGDLKGTATLIKSSNVRKI